MIDTHDVHAPVSRTYTYKKVTKPLLERKRRARINKCLEELKDLMVGALLAEGENVSKLEKADILELTVRHLHRLRRSSNAGEEAFRFQAGFNQCAAEACNFLLNLPGVDADVGQRLVNHLQMVVGPLSIQVPNFRLTFSPPVSPASPSTSRSPSSEAILSTSPTFRDLDLPHTGLLMKAETGVKRKLSADSGDSQTGMWRPW
ncbi:UNVERIFIED_CONTAM: hypothetical protein PYX00_003151 [Menopon gallinae]|uniref:Uncharacterized protein n=1 Tax=Menopon gallinae TaxID=328185 RepID=A0AAW2HZB7_9NEOP